MVAIVQKPLVRQADTNSCGRDLRTVDSLSCRLVQQFDAHHNPLWDQGHIKFWPVATLTRLLEEAGFDAIDSAPRKIDDRNCQKNQVTISGTACRDAHRFASRAQANVAPNIDSR